MTDCNDQADALDRVHKNGFRTGYKAAMYDVWNLIRALQIEVGDVSDAHIEAKYREIFKGLDEPSPEVVAVLQELQRRLEEGTA